MAGLEYYAFGLAEKVGVTQKGIVLNPHFSEWEGLLNDVLKHNSQKVLGPGYQKPEAAKLLKECRAHAREHCKAKLQEEILSFVHPFYIALTDSKFLRHEQIRGEYESFIDRVFELLNMAPGLGLSRVMFETAHHYAMFSSLLAEMGLIDRVIFTEPNMGIVLKKSQIWELWGKTQYIFGAYNGICLSDLCMQMKMNGCGRLNLNVIKELVLDPPYPDIYPNSIIESGTLMPKDYVFEIAPGAKRICFADSQLLGIDDILADN